MTEQNGGTEQDGRAAVRLAQANQRLEQESAIFARKLERDRQSSRLQAAMGWTVLVMLPLIATVCVFIFFNSQSVPHEIVLAASGAFFVDVAGMVVAGYKGLLPTKPREELLTPVTCDPYGVTRVEQDVEPNSDNGQNSRRSDQNGLSSSSDHSVPSAGQVAAAKD